MSEFKVIVDVLSSVTSFIAITTVLFYWYRSAQKPLSIQRVVVHNKKESKRFILVVKNHKDYPVTIKGINGFLKSKAQVEKFNGYEPEYREYYLYMTAFLSVMKSLRLQPMGTQILRLKIHLICGQVKSLCFRQIHLMAIMSLSVKILQTSK